MQLKGFTFNPLQENTYVIWDESLDCALIDPGCHHRAEREELEAFVTEHKLKPVRHLLTHAHFDHTFGCAWVHERWGLLPECHAKEIPVLQMTGPVAEMYGFRMDVPPAPEKFFAHGDKLTLGNSLIEIRWAPGHSPGSVLFYNPRAGWAVVGDVIFRESVGRTDLPLGSERELKASILNQVYTLPENTVLHPGHGPVTTVKHEKRYNPFVSGH